MSSESSFIISMRKIVEDSHDPKAKIFDVFIQVMILISIITFSLETVPGLAETYSTTFYILEIVSVSIFTAEYILRIVIAKNRVKFIFSFFGIVDLLAILPFYLTLGIDLRTIRILRFLRLFRMFELTKFHTATERITTALRLAREELILFLMLSGTLIYVSAVGIYYFENEAQPDSFSSIFHSLWWAVITLTTVGYGDVYPITLGGRMFTFLILIIGVGIISIPAGLIAAALNQARRVEEEKKSSKRPRSM
ncbi:ion transporter [Hyphobacterium sp. CCMP332]|nr:ion transporter [Hyphobacterium sp. CCMP332]